MPKGPRGEKRPADAIGLAVLVGKIATGEVEDTRDDLKKAATQLGSKGGEARARKLSGSEREAIARKAAQARWQKDRAALDEKELP